MSETHRKQACKKAEEISSRKSNKNTAKKRLRKNSSISFNFQDACDVGEYNRALKTMSSIDLKFYESFKGERTGRTWPEEQDKVYVFQRNPFLPSNKYVTLNCARGTLVCYGARALEDGDGVQWGLGIEGNQSCSNCCFACGNNAGNINLRC